jgi:DNA-directed RNA polymerase specialized sigma54-like protein
MNIEVNERDLEMIIAMLKLLDPTGFFAGKLSNNLVEQLNNNKVEFKEIKNN